MANNNGSLAINTRFEGDYSGDPASGGFFHTDFKKHDDLRMMLDSNKDNLKLEAMKRIIGMIAKGRDASMLFPAVVKNVVSKNIEIKKLVYVYLERFAEEQQDLALLSISTFQRALKEPNPLIRAGALRVLSSIRVKMISPIVMLAIKDASSDMSSYVRKTAAHAIPKLYSIDPELKPELINIIQKLLADKTVLVIGSAVMAFTEVCPERTDLIHAVYRKLCALIVDVDEWGQVTIVHMLTRYARLNFVDPNRFEENENNQSANDSSSEVSEKPVLHLDPDHRLLLRSTRPLLQSRNAAVVMSVAQLYHHAAPKSEIILAAKALIRLLRSHMEVQTVVLNTIASISTQNKSIFEPYLKSFFVRTSDPTNIKLLKLEILTNLATETNISIILRELQTYITHTDMKFVSATIQAIGRCACSITEVTDSCLNGLVLLLSNKDEALVAESVVVIKRLLQTQAADPKEIITHMSKLLDSITVAQARAAIIWLLGEHSQKVPHIAPDILRKLAKGFADEHDIVKLQVINLAVKLYITNPEQTKMLCHYIFNLARYDQNYDIRDKARMLKQCLPNQEGKISSFAERIFLASKPAPNLQSQYKDYNGYQLGSLSHYIKMPANGYEPLPKFPENPPSGDLRVDPIYFDTDSRGKTKKGKVLFSWELDGNSVNESNSSNEESSSSATSSSSSESETSESEEESLISEKKSRSENESSSYSSSEELDSEEESSNVEEEKKQELSKEPEKVPKSNLDLLLELKEETDFIGPIMAPATADDLYSSGDTKKNSVQDCQPVFLNMKPIELLNKINGQGLSITYRFTRMLDVFNPKLVTLNLMFTNHTTDEVTNIVLSKSSEASEVTVQEFTALQKLSPNGTLSSSLFIDFHDSTNPCQFNVTSSLGTSTIFIKPNIGELMKPVTMSSELFNQHVHKLQGMNACSKTIPLSECKLFEKATESANVGSCPSEDINILRFAGKTLSLGHLVLISLHKCPPSLIVKVNCENPVFGSVLLNHLCSCLSLLN